MHYELYVDSLFFINFIMNLYLLVLVNHSTLRTATPGRLVAGAAVGALGGILPFLGAAPIALKLVLGGLAATAGMLCTAFPIRGIRMFLKLLERLAIYTFGMGGAMLFLIRILPGLRESLTGLFGILGVGGVVFLLLKRFRSGLKNSDCLCKATLVGSGEKIEVMALIDSGNSLIEPISGKPVCVVEREMFRKLWKNEAGGFRAIPYHSVGKKRGIMPGYLLPKLQLELEGLNFVFTDVYVAVSDEEISGEKSSGAESVKIIVNPGLFGERGKGRPRKRQNERKNDSESGNTGQNAV